MELYDVKCAFCGAVMETAKNPSKVFSKFKHVCPECMDRLQYATMTCGLCGKGSNDIVLVVDDEGRGETVCGDCAARQENHEQLFRNSIERAVKETFTGVTKELEVLTDSLSKRYGDEVFIGKPTNVTVEYKDIDGNPVKMDVQL